MEHRRLYSPWAGEKWCWAPETLELAVITSPPRKLASPQGPMQVKANNYSLRVIIYILGGLVGRINPFFKNTQLLFSGPWLQCHLLATNPSGLPIRHILFYWASQALLFLKKKLKVCGNYASSKSKSAIFSNGPQMVRSMIPLRNWKEINLAGAKQTWRDELTAQKVSKASLHLYPDTARSFPMHNPLPHCQQGARWRGSREQLVRAIRSILKDIRVWIPALWP